MLEPQAPKSQPVSRVDFRQEESYSGEHAIQHEVLQAQLSFYKWGSWVWKIVIIVFIAGLILVTIVCVLSALFPMYGASLFLQILQKIFPIEITIPFEITL
jgi:thiol:disulfide interchange protein